MCLCEPRGILPHLEILCSFSVMMFTRMEVEFPIKLESKCVVEVEE